MKILVLHGYGQTAETVRKNTNISRAFAGHTLVYLNAPHAVLSPPARSWWTYADAPSVTVTTYPGIQESIELVRRELPFHGIVGFSQGGTFASIMCGLFPVCFAVFISAYAALDKDYVGVYDIAIGHFVHIVGEQDEIVKRELSEELHEILGGELVYHPQGHVIPKLKDIIQVRDAIQYCSQDTDIEHSDIEIATLTRKRRVNS